jgi:hypothetical protein
MRGSKYSYSFVLKALMVVEALCMISGCATCQSPLSASFEIQPAPGDKIDFAQVASDAKAKPPAIPKLGDVLIFGGASNEKGPLATAEFYDPATKKFTATGALLQARLGPAGSELTTPLGQVLVAGGLGGNVTVNLKKDTYVINAKPTDIELYNPATGSFGSAGSPITPRTGYTQTLLNDGTVLIAGGSDTRGLPTNEAEIFDPLTETTKQTTGNMVLARALHTATLIKGCDCAEDGEVLITGGVYDPNYDTTDTAEIYDPMTKTFALTTGTIKQIVPGGTAAAPMAAHTATLLNNGKVLLVDGFEGGQGSVDTANQIAVLYDPVTEEFTPTTGQPIDDRAFQSANLLPNGLVLIAGGLYGQAQVSNGIAFGIYGGARNSAELYDPTTDAFTCVTKAKKGTNCGSSMTNSRAGHTATLMTSGPLAGDVLLAGGIGGTTTTVKGKGAPLKTAELYDPVANKFVKTGAMTAARAGQGAALLQ